MWAVGIGTTKISRILGVLHQEMFGNFACGQQAFDKVINNLDGVRECLKKIPRHPIMPYQLAVCNNNVGEIMVSLHAWDRFCERFFPLEPYTRVVLKALRGSFANARLTHLSKMRELIRLINNNGAEAQYLVDPNLNCRFVVVISDKKEKVLGTVEVPVE